jgi:hypothetical protein
MICPSCNDNVPDTSQFCVNCGSIFPPKVSEVQLHNTTIPTEIAIITALFEEGMEKVKGLFGINTDKVARNLTFAIQLVDKNKNTTAYNGEVRIKGKIYQGYKTDNGMSGTSWTYLSNYSFDFKPTARISDFYRATGQAKLSWKYKHPTPFIIVSGYNVAMEVEVWFTPNGGQKLYKNESIVLSST